MNYNSIQDIFDSGITNMTILRDNQYLDINACQTVEGADWFIYQGKARPEIDFRGSGEIYLGKQYYVSGVLNIKNASRGIYYIYREEGTLYNIYRFLKFRCIGYNVSMSIANMLNFDVIIFETGDIAIHINSVPVDLPYGPCHINSPNPNNSNTIYDFNDLSLD